MYREVYHLQAESTSRIWSRISDRILMEVWNILQYAGEEQHIIYLGSFQSMAAGTTYLVSCNCVLQILVFWQRHINLLLLALPARP